jgi:Mn-dependent DtxR family transcriptional regulator
MTKTSRLSELDREILTYLGIVGGTDAADIAEVLGVSEHSVQEALHKLDDEGHVMMRLGWYRLSEAQKAGRL